MSNYNFIGNFLGKKPDLKKDGHDLSNRECGSMPFGTHVPLTVIPCVPNEHYKGHVGALVQTATMKEDNFATIYDNLKAVFVPYSSICRDYASLLNSVTTRARIDPAIPRARFYIVDLIEILNPMYGLYVIYNGLQRLKSLYPNIENAYFIQGSSSGYGYSSIHLGYGNDVPYAQYNTLDPWVQTMFNFIYNLGYHPATSATNSYLWRFGRLYSLFNKFVSPSGSLICFDVLRLLDNLGYGNYLPLFEDFYAKFEGRTANNSFGLTGIPSSATSDASFATLSMTVSTLLSSHMSSTQLSVLGSVDLMTLLAYQYYINVYEKSNYRLPTTYVLTADAISSVASQLSFLSLVSGTNTYKFNPGFSSGGSLMSSTDFVNGKVNLANFMSGNNGTTSLTRYSFFIYLFSLSNPLLSQDIFTTMQQSVVLGSVPTTTSTALTADLVKTIAETSALYKLRQDLLRAGVRRDKQIESLFGVSGANNLYESVDILDSSTTVVNIQGLINMSDSEFAPLGIRAAKGNGQNELNFEFHSKDYGFLFIIQSFTCESYYENFMIERFHRLSPESYFVPQLAHLGLEQLTSKDISFMTSSVSNNSNSILISNNNSYGYTSRNFELKQRVNKAHGAFTNYGFDTSYLVDPNVYNEHNSPSLLRGNSYFGGYIPTLIDQQVNCFANVGDLYFNPSMVNNIFVDMFHPSLFCDFTTDHFRCAYSIELHKVSPMPKIGLFKLNV